MRSIKRLGALAVAGVLLLAPAAVYGKTAAPATVDEHIQHQLRNLTYYTVFDNISYRVDNGTVILFGQVTKPVLKVDAERLVKDVEGLTAVRNEIEVLPFSQFDDQIRVSTYRAIYGYGPLQHYSVGSQNPIHIIVNNGKVTLTGLVVSDSDRKMAYMRANSVPGVFFGDERS